MYINVQFQVCEKKIKRLCVHINNLHKANSKNPLTPQLSLSLSFSLSLSLSLFFFFFFFFYFSDLKKTLTALKSFSFNSLRSLSLSEPSSRSSYTRVGSDFSSLFSLFLCVSYFLGFFFVSL